VIADVNHLHIKRIHLKFLVGHLYIVRDDILITLVMYKKVYAIFLFDNLECNTNKSSRGRIQTATTSYVMRPAQKLSTLVLRTPQAREDVHGAKKAVQQFLLPHSQATRYALPNGQGTVKMFLMPLISTQRLSGRRLV
jgi:hypothetical protein